MGHHDGTITFYDCLKTEVIKQARLVNDAVLALAYLNKSANLLVYTETKAVILSTADDEIKIVEQWPIKKK